MFGALAGGSAALTALRHAATYVEPGSVAYDGLTAAYDLVLGASRGKLKNELRRDELDIEEDARRKKVSFDRQLMPVAPYKGTLTRGGVRPVIRSEIKAVDISLDELITDDTLLSYTAYPINGIREGPAFYERIGRRICMKSVCLNAMMLPATSPVQTSSEVRFRFAIIYDRQPNGQTPTFAQIFFGRRYDGSTVGQAWLAEINLDNRDRFLILQDERVDISGDRKQTAATSTSSFVVNLNQFKWHRFIDLKGMETQYKNTDQTIASLSTGALWFILYIDKGADSTNTVKLAGSIRLRYWDT